MSYTSKTILITGASGFIGKALTLHLHKNNFQVETLTRSVINGLPSSIRQNHFEGFPASNGLYKILKGIDVVVHCAARVHIMNEKATNPLTAFREVNVKGTRNLAEHAKKAGVKRFILLSSIKVNGEETKHGFAYRSSDPPQPSDPYGISKFEAENAIRRISTKTDMEHVIIRPVLVYGPGVKANFAQLIRMIAKGIPLPLGSCKNKRSLLAIDNLVDLIATCIDHPAAANQTFLASDNDDQTTTELIRKIGLSLHRPAKLIPFPHKLLKHAATILGKHSIAKRLLGSLQVDISHTCRTLDWQPPTTIKEALQNTIDSFPNP